MAYVCKVQIGEKRLESGPDWLGMSGGMRPQ